MSEVANYLREKKEIAAKEDDVFSDVAVKTKKQVENAATFFKELMSRRRKKILHLVFVAAETGISKQDFENMFAFEKELFEELMKCIDDSDKNVDEFEAHGGQVLLVPRPWNSLQGVDTKEELADAFDISFPFEIKLI